MVCFKLACEYFADEFIQTVVGTPFFMAPEIRYGKTPYGLTVDSWSLGCVIFNMCVYPRCLYFDFLSLTHISTGLLEQDHSQTQPNKLSSQSMFDIVRE